MADSLLGENLPTTETRESIIAKWKDKPQDELLNAKAESDLYIKTLEARFDEMKNDYLHLREQNTASTELRTLIDQLKNPVQQNLPITEGNTVQPAIKTEDIEALVKQQISQAETVRRQENNFNVVQAKLREQLGENYQSAYKQRLDTLGLSKDFADDLARNHPSVFLKTFDLESSAHQSAPSLPRNQQRPTSFAPRTQKRDWNYYQELKKSDPRLWLDPKISIQMHNDAIELGSEFGMPED